MLTTHDNILTDRGSKYAVSGGPATNKSEALALIKALKRQKKFARATHNTWALLTEQGPLKNDDGEAGAGMVIVRMLEREGLQDHVIIVTRWFGGMHLGGDRFRRVQDCVNIYLDKMRGAWMSFLKKLFGGGGGSKSKAPIEEYEGRESFYDILVSSSLNINSKPLDGLGMWCFFEFGHTSGGEKAISTLNLNASSTIFGIIFSITVDELVWMHGLVLTSMSQTLNF